MSDSQIWSDVIAMALSLRSDEGLEEYESILKDYCWEDHKGEPIDFSVDVRLVTAMITILASLIDATAEYLEMTPEELGQFLLMEKFKRDLFDGS